MTPRLFAPAVLAALFGASLAAQGSGNFGSSVAVGAREVVVGQPLNDYAPGTVYVYRPNVRGEWREAAKFTAEGGAPGDWFGRSLSLDGDRLLIGATRADSNRGAAYLFERDRSGAWHQVAKLQPAQVTPSSPAFGRAVLLRGDLAVVAAVGEDSARGAVYVYRRGTGGWTQEARVQPADARPNGNFGVAVAIAGGRLLAGSPNADSATGAAYLFGRDSTGNWRQEAKLTPPGAPRFARFGTAIVARDTELLIGAPGYERFSGAVFVFRRDSITGRWNAAERLSAFDATGGGAFGYSVSYDGTEALITARSGVYRMTRDTSGWTSSTKVPYGESSETDAFGSVVGVSGDVGVIGIGNADLGEGAAAILTRAPRGVWTRRARVVGDVKLPEAVLGGRVECQGGKANIYSCGQADLLSFLPVSRLGGGRGVQTNTVWGWTDPQTNREYAIVGKMDGTAFVDVTDPGAPVYIGSLPKTAAAHATVWRELKVYHNHVFIVSDGSGPHGMQVFDLTRLRSVARPPVTFTEDAHYDRVNSAHNIAIDTASGFAYITGANGGGETCGGGLHMVDIRDPRKPTFVGCFADTQTGRQRTGYSHDVLCVLYRGPDQRYQGKQICIGSNETALSIADVTDKTSPVAISRASYPNVGYTHQGWFTEDQKYFFVDDELDELQGLVPGTRTLIWDLSSLSDPVLAGEYISQSKAIDHNLYIRGNLMYQSNYLAGLRVLDISDPKNPREVAFFDTVPVGDNGPTFGGTWNNYPFFRSGAVAVASMREGLFMVRVNPRPPIP